MSWEIKAPQVQDALVALLQADSRLDAWAPEFGLPLDPTKSDLFLFVDEDISEWENQPDTTGVSSHIEGFDLFVYVYSRKTGADQKEIRDEIWDTCNVVAEIVGNNPTLSGTCLYARLKAPSYRRGITEEQGRQLEGMARLTISCQAFVSAM